MHPVGLHSVIDYRLPKTAQMAACLRGRLVILLCRILDMLTRELNSREALKCNKCPRPRGSQLTHSCPEVGITRTEIHCYQAKSRRVHTYLRWAPERPQHTQSEGANSTSLQQSKEYSTKGSKQRSKYLQACTADKSDSAYVKATKM